MPWKKIPGTLVRISAGSATNVWGVNKSGDIYTGDDTNPWVQIPGSLTDIGAGADGTVWGVNAANDVFRFNNGPSHWTKVPGSLTRISAGSRSNVWGVNAAGTVSRYTTDDADPWVPIPGVALADISAGADGTVWGVSPTFNAYRFTGDQGGPNNWVQIPGSLSAVSAGSVTNVWGINGPNVAKYVGNVNRPWCKIAVGAPLDGGLLDIASGADGVVWGTSLAGNVYRWVYD